MMTDLIRPIVAIALLTALAGCASGSLTAKHSFRQTKNDGPGVQSLLGTGIAEMPQNLPKSRSGNPAVYEVFGKQYYVMDSSEGYHERGRASWYGSKFHGRKTSSGEVYNMYNLTAAHKSLPLPTFVTVTNLENGKQIIVKVNDRGPFHSDRIIDLSYAAAAELGVLETGTAAVDVAAISVNVENKPDSTGENPVPTIIQVGAFSDKSRAEAMRKQVDEAMRVKAAYIVTAENAALFKVRFGVHPNVSIKKILSHLNDAGIVKYTVIE